MGWRCDSQLEVVNSGSEQNMLMAVLRDLSATRRSVRAGHHAHALSKRSCRWLTICLLKSAAKEETVGHAPKSVAPGSIAPALSLPWITVMNQITDMAL